MVSNVMNFCLINESYVIHLFDYPFWLMEITFLRCEKNAMDNKIRCDRGTE